MTFLDFCRASGIIIDTYPPLGVWKRYKTVDKPAKRNGAVKWMGDHGFCRNWATDSEPNSWQESGTSSTARPVDMARIQAQRDMERRHRVMAVHGARAFWSRAKPLVGQHPYLSAKGLSAVGCAGLRTHEDLLVVPVTSGDVMTSVQTITPEGVKRFWAGAPVKAGSFILDRHNAAITILCEGLATGLACFQSVKNSRVIVCFDAGNLLPVTQLLKPQGSVVFMADNDYKTKALRGTNPGIEKATNAAELIGAGVAWVDEIEGTDAADYLYEMGQGAGKKLERLILAKAKYVMT